MTFIADMYYLNSEVQTGVKDPSKVYYMALFMQGTETLRIMCRDRVVYDVLQTIPQMSLLTLEVNYNAQYRDLRLLSCLPVEK